jgi:hypothetical protein
MKERSLFHLEPEVSLDKGWIIIIREDSWHFRKPGCFVKSVSSILQQFYLTHYYLLIIVPSSLNDNGTPYQ